MFSSIVFGRSVRLVQCVPIIFVLLYHVYSDETQIQQENVMNFSDDFEGFLKDLGTKVYKTKKTSREDEEEQPQTTSTQATTRQNDQKSDAFYKTKKAFLGDVLMMKLVSYYEEKYKLANSEPTTTEQLTIASTHASAKYNELDGNPPIYIDKDKDVEINQNYILQNNNAEHIPEVVVL